ncbi:MAG: DUF2304 domain-containing protein [Candidatus Omnitrophica bacterium]|nr:DUF2304 domain-containing protein [Candidatus Omnitrophota bacterium]
MSRILAISISLCLMLVILELVRRKKLKEKYAILWLFAGSIILILAIFNNILNYITNLLGIVLSINTVFFFGIFFIILMNIHFSLVISSLSEQNKKIAQRLALLEIEVKKNSIEK